MKCPLCNKHELVDQSLEDCGGRNPDRFCPEVVNIGGKLFNHYREVPSLGRTRIIIPPYRIITEDGVSLISIQSRYKTGEKKHYFKFILEVPELHLDTAEKLRDRVKLLLLLS